MKLLTETAEMNAAYAECSFESEDHLQDSIYHSLIEQPNIFAAMSLVNEIDTLNNIQVVSNYTIGRVKAHYRQNGMGLTKQENGNRENGLSNIGFPQDKVDSPKGENKVDFHKEESKKEKLKRDMQKGYMKMLSNLK